MTLYKTWKLVYHIWPFLARALCVMSTIYAFGLQLWAKYIRLGYGWQMYAPQNIMTTWSFVHGLHDPLCTDNDPIGVYMVYLYKMTQWFVKHEPHCPEIIPLLASRLVPRKSFVVCEVFSPIMFTCCTSCHYILGVSLSLLQEQIRKIALWRSGCE